MFSRKDRYFDASIGVASEPTSVCVKLSMSMWLAV